MRVETGGKNPRVALTSFSWSSLNLFGDGGSRMSMSIPELRGVDGISRGPLGSSYMTGIGDA